MISEFALNDLPPRIFYLHNWREPDVRIPQTMLTDMRLNSACLHFSLAIKSRDLSEGDNGQKGFSFPSNELIQSMTGLGIKAINSAKKTLQNAGWIKIQRMGLGKTNRYYFGYPWMENLMDFLNEFRFLEYPLRRVVVACPDDIKDQFLMLETLLPSKQTEYNKKVKELSKINFIRPFNKRNSICEIRQSIISDIVNEIETNLDCSLTA